jgi:hypothetical protein
MGDAEKVRVAPEPHVLDGTTSIFPAVAPTITVILFVVPPAVCDHPDGRIQE